MDNALIAFEPNLGLTLKLIIGVVIPLAVGLVTTKVTASGTKALLLAGLSLVAGVLTEFAAAVSAGQTFELFASLAGALTIFLIAVGTHYGLWKPVGASRALQAVGAREDGSYKVSSLPDVNPDYDLASGPVVVGSRARAMVDGVPISPSKVVLFAANPSDATAYRRAHERTFVGNRAQTLSIYHLDGLRGYNIDEILVTPMADAKLSDTGRRELLRLAGLGGSEKPIHYLDD
jgi:hypothetical protein